MVKNLDSSSLNLYQDFPAIRHFFERKAALRDMFCRRREFISTETTHSHAGALSEVYKEILKLTLETTDDYRKNMQIWLDKFWYLEKEVGFSLDKEGEPHLAWVALYYVKCEFFSYIFRFFNFLFFISFYTVF